MFAVLIFLLDFISSWIGEQAKIQTDDNFAEQQFHALMLLYFFHVASENITNHISPNAVFNWIEQMPNEKKIVVKIDEGKVARLAEKKFVFKYAQALIVYNIETKLHIHVKHDGKKGCVYPI